MDDTKLVPITRENLDLLMAIASEFGMPRSHRWYERLLYGGSVEDESRCRGYLVQSSDEGVVGCLCVGPVVGYFRQKKKTFHRVAVLACRQKFGVCALQMIAEVVDRIGGELSFTNSLWGQKSGACWRNFAHYVNGPESGSKEYVFAPFSLEQILESPYFKARPRKTRLVRFVLRPLEFVLRFVDCINARNNFGCLEVRSFTNPAFPLFWNEFLAANDGVMTSREPQLLARMFDGALETGVMELMGSFVGGKLKGYILLRRRDADGFHEYRVADWCALGHDEDVLMRLLRAAINYCRRHRGRRLSFTGGNAVAVQIAKQILKNECDLGRQTFVYRVDDKEMQDSLAKNEGWFFGPYDGDRCLGYGGYVDL